MISLGVVPKSNVWQNGEYRTCSSEHQRNRFSTLPVGVEARRVLPGRRGGGLARGRADVRRDGVDARLSVGDRALGVVRVRVDEGNGCHVVRQEPWLAVPRGVDERLSPGTRRDAALEE